jgi:plastocyanin domain-containing protein
MKAFYLILSLIVITVIAFLFLYFSDDTGSTEEVKAKNTETVTEENGIQIINVISTSGGYFPAKITAKAGKKTLLRMESQNSYGCERSFRIPSLKITEILPQQGTTEIDLGTPNEGENILGSCSMGMYTFTIKFE